MIQLKSEDDIKYIKLAAKIWKEVRDKLIANTKSGVTTKQLDIIAKDYIEQHDATCTFHKYNGFPGYICISVNDQLIHGIGSNYALKPGDLITFDIGVTYHKHVCDSAVSLVVPGKDNPTAEKINQATLQCLNESIKEAVIGNYIGDISNKIEVVATQNGYEVVRDFTGHGCGNQLHEDPSIPCYGKKHTGAAIVENMVLCIEPMLLTKTYKYYIDKKNNWTVYANNGLLTCHWEHMILITKHGPEILTL